MSRSALWRQEANVKERERNAQETFRQAVEEGKNKHVKGAIPLVCPYDTFNLNSMLIQNVSKSPYFLKCCSKLQDWSTLVDEIYYEVKHMEPWATGGFKVPSTAFCLLVRLFTLRCTEKQMASMLSHPDSPYIRCIGFLYLRYAAEPSLIWGWFEPYLYDEEPVRIVSDPKKEESTVGQFARDLLTEMNYYGTVLPRLPVAIERDIKVKMLLAEKVEERALKHLRGSDPPAVECFDEGMRVRALYGDDDNPVTWYDAVIDRVVRRDEETGEQLARPKYWVTFPEYGNSECVSLGEIDMLPMSPGRGRDERRRDYERSDGRTADRDWTGRDSTSRRPNGRDRWDDRRGRGDRDGYDEDYRSQDFGGGGGHEQSDERRRDRGRGYRMEDDRPRDRHRPEQERRGYGCSRERNDDAPGGHGRRRHKASRSRSRSWSRGREPDRPASSSRPPDRSSQEHDLMEEVMRREREKSAAQGKAYAQRPATFKRSLAARHDAVGSSTARRSRSRSRSPGRRHGGKRRRGTDDSAKKSPAVEAPVREKTAAERAAIEEKKRKLMERYG